MSPWLNSVSLSSLAKGEFSLRQRRRNSAEARGRRVAGTRHDMDFFSWPDLKLQDLDCAKQQDWLNGRTDVTKSCRDAHHPDWLTRQRTDLKGACRNWIWKTSSHFLISEEITFVGFALFIQRTTSKQWCAYKSRWQKRLWNWSEAPSVSSSQTDHPGREIKASASQPNALCPFNSKYTTRWPNSPPKSLQHQQVKKVTRWFSIQ